MTDAQGAPSHDRPQQPDPDATPARGVPAVPPPSAPAPGPAASAAPAGAPDAGNPFAPPARPSTPVAGPYPPVAGQPLGAPGHPAPGARPSRPGRRIAAWIGGGVAAALVLGAGTVGAVRALGGSDAAQPTVGSQGEVVPVDLGGDEFDEIHVGVARDHEFELPISWAVEDLTTDGSSLPTEEIVRVYIDPQLTVPADDAMARVGWEGALVVTPVSDGVSAGRFDLDTSGDVERVELARPGEWGMYERYYIAEYRDRGTGAPLAEPYVTAFTVDTGIPAPSVTFDVDAQGVGHFTWEPVAGATEYYVVKTEQYSSTVVGSTEDTTWTTAEDDEAVQRTLDPDDPWYGDVTTQNSTFKQSVWTDDMLQQEGAPLVADEQEVVAFGVAAVTPDGVGPMSPLDGAGLAQRLPNARAYTAAEETGSLARDVRTAEDLPANYPISMADGRTVMRPLDYDVDAIEPVEWIVGEEDENGAMVNPRQEIRYAVPYTINGTLFTGDFDIAAPDAATADAWARAAVERAAASRVPTGEAQPFTYADPRGVDLDAVEISTTAPDVPYQVNGSNPLTTYLAANLLDGQRYIDLSAFFTGGATVTPTGVELWDAWGEAVQQNPLAGAVARTSAGYVPGRQVLVVEYAGWADDAARRAAQEELAAEVDRVVAEIITDGMSEEAKVRAIDGYLTSVATYDDAALAARDAGDPSAFLDSWNATGVLLGDTGVCASYAQAFKALADASGLTSVYVTGVAVASGEGHAWNKVRIGDAWRVVDPTWNDGVGQALYLLQTDAEAAPERTEDADWMLDSRLAEYAAR